MSADIPESSQGSALITGVSARRVNVSIACRGGVVAIFRVRTLWGSRPGRWRGLEGESVELFGRGEILLTPTCQLPFPQHVHQFDTDQGGLRRVKRFEP